MCEGEMTPTADLPFANSRMATILLIGYGNPLCGDDGVGWRIVEEVDALRLPIETAAIHQLTPEWAEPISRAELVIFADAAAVGEPGEVALFPLQPSASRQGSHETTAEGLLASAAELFGRCPPAYIVTVAGESFELSESLTEPVEQAVAVAVGRVRELIQTFTSR